MKVRLVNCTPHTVNLYTNTGAIIALEPSGDLPRVSTQSLPKDCVETDSGYVEVAVETLGEVFDLPAEQPDTVLIVSRIVAQAAVTRRDLVFPFKLLRDDNGRVTGCSVLGKVPPKL